jgi:YVTN family beta-propeller protein
MVPFSRSKGKFRMTTSLWQTLRCGNGLLSATVARQIAGWTLLLALTGCGGSGGGGSSSSQPDFSLALNPTTKQVSAGSQASVSLSAVAIDSFSSQISVQLTGIPAGVTVSPTSITLTPGTPQQVTFNAASYAINSSGTVTFTGTSGTLQHTAALALTVNGSSSGVPARTRYRRTDATTEYSHFLNQHWIVYHAATQRYFVTDPSSNLIHVIDATTQQEIATIPVPGAFGIDDTPDHNTLWVGTQIGDVYSINPVSMTVIQRYVGSAIGPSGYPASSVQVLADGRLALIGEYGGIDGTTSVAVWNPTDNSITIYGAYGGQGAYPCGFFTQFSGFSRTVDRTHILLANYESSSVCELDPSTGTYVTGGVPGNPYSVFPTPDGEYIIVPSYYPNPSAVVLDAQTLATVAQYAVMGDTGSDAAFVISADSSTLFTPSDSIIYAYSLVSGQMVGWVPNLYLPGLSSGTDFGPPFGPDLQATNGTGLFAGPMEEGIGFADLSNLNTGPVGSQFVDGELNPATGSLSGGTTTQWPAPGVVAPLSSIYFGSHQATAISYSSENIHATSPAGTAGPVDIYAFVSDGGLQVIPEAFSYGPTILEVTPNMSTAEGGGTGYIYGYGFGPINSNSIPTGLQVTVNGASVPVTAFTGNAYNIDPPPFPLQSIAYTIPSGVSGGAVNVAVTTSAGSATASAALSYLPPIEQFPLAGASLAEGIYDPYTDLYYFTDKTQVRVFSRTQGQWLPSINITPPPGTNENLWGIALSPDGSKMAVSDATAGAIYVLNPANPGTVQTFVVGSNYPFLVNPCGLAISNAGNVYYWVYVLGQGGGADQFFKLNTSTGQITNYGIDSPGLGLSDLYLRNAISADNSVVYNNDDGAVFVVDTATDQLVYAPDDDGCCYGNYELSLSSDETQLTATDFLYDNLLNGESAYALNDREALNMSYVYGAKLNHDGKLIFQPYSNGVDVLDGNLGNLRMRISLPVALSANYDALAVDPNDNVLIAITGDSGDGIAIVDLTSLPEPSLSHQAVRNKRTPSAGSVWLVGPKPLRRMEKDSGPAAYRRMVPHVTGAGRSRSK